MMEVDKEPPHRALPPRNRSKRGRRMPPAETINPDRVWGIICEIVDPTSPTIQGNTVSPKDYYVTERVEISWYYFRLPNEFRNADPSQSIPLQPRDAHVISRKTVSVLDDRRVLVDSSSFARFHKTKNIDLRSYRIGRPVMPGDDETDPTNPAYRFRGINKHLQIRVNGLSGVRLSLDLRDLYDHSTNFSVFRAPGATPGVLEPKRVIRCGVLRVVFKQCSAVELDVIDVGSDGYLEFSKLSIMGAYNTPLPVDDYLRIDPRFLARDLQKRTDDSNNVSFLSISMMNFQVIPSHNLSALDFSRLTNHRARFHDDVNREYNTITLTDCVLHTMLPITNPVLDRCLRSYSLIKAQPPDDTKVIGRSESIVIPWDRNWLARYTSLSRLNIDGSAIGDFLDLIHEEVITVARSAMFRFLRAQLDVATETVNQITDLVYSEHSTEEIENDPSILKSETGNYKKVIKALTLILNMMTSDRYDDVTKLGTARLYDTVGFARLVYAALKVSVDVLSARTWEELAIETGYNKPNLSIHKSALHRSFGYVPRGIYRIYNAIMSGDTSHEVRDEDVVFIADLLQKIDVNFSLPEAYTILLITKSMLNENIPRSNQLQRMDPLGPNRATRPRRMQAVRGRVDPRRRPSRADRTQRDNQGGHLASEVA